MLNRSLCLFLPLLLCGCFLAPAIDSFNQLGVTQRDRQALLEKEIKRFQEARFWGSRGEASGYLDVECSPKEKSEILSTPSDERIVESKVEGIEFSNDSYQASVKVKVKFYKVPYFVVSDRIEAQGWKFSLGDGWKVASRNVL